jgi:hypothetical protein
MGSYPPKGGHWFDPGLRNNSKRMVTTLFKSRNSSNPFFIVKKARKISGPF